MCVHIILSSVWVAEWPPFGKELLTRLTICSLCILLFVILVISRFGFEGWIWGLNPSVPGLCIPFYFSYAKDKIEMQKACHNQMKHQTPFEQKGQNNKYSIADKDFGSLPK